MERVNNLMQERLNAQIPCVHKIYFYYSFLINTLNPIDHNNAFEIQHIYLKILSKIEH